MLRSKLAHGLLTLSDHVRAFGIMQGVPKCLYLLVSTNFLPRGREFSVVSPAGDKVILRAGDTDWNVYSSSAVLVNYNLSRSPQDKMIQNYYSEICKAGKTPIIIDGGGNIGLTSLYFARRYPEAIVTLIEPDPSNMALARRNTAGIANIRYFECGLWSEEAEIVPANVGVGSASLQFREAVGSERGSGLIARSIDSIIDEFDQGIPFIIKLDIEGAEGRVLGVPSRWIDDTPVLMVEPHAWEYPGAKLFGGLLINPSYQQADIFISSDIICFVPIKYPTQPVTLRP